MAKEMLPVVDKPVIQYVVEEVVASGIKDIVIVTGALKRAIEDHFDAPNAELIKNLEASGKDELLAQTRKSPRWPILFTSGKKALWQRHSGFISTLGYR